MTDPTAELAIQIRRGQCTPAELAALIAVVSEAYTGEADTAVAGDNTRPDAWNLTRRGLRAPLQRGAHWGQFTG